MIYANCFEVNIAKLLKTLFLSALTIKGDDYFDMETIK